jgi:hypothetical protein
MMQPEPRSLQRSQARPVCMSGPRPGARLTVEQVVAQAKLQPTVYRPSRPEEQRPAA